MVLLHPLNNIEITNYLKHEASFNGVSLRNNLPRIRDGGYVINLNDKKVKEHIEFHYLLIEKQLYTLILLKLSIFL